MESLDFANIKRLGYRLVVDGGCFALYKGGSFPVLVSEDPIAVADWLIDHA